MIDDFYHVVETFDLLCDPVGPMIAQSLGEGRRSKKQEIGAHGDARDI